MRNIVVEPFDAPEFDTPADAVSTRTLTYVVCATPRSGSGLLTRALGGAGVAGTPTEYFNPARRSVLSKRWRCGPGLADYTEALYARRTSPTGVFGTKLHWHQVEALYAETLGRKSVEVPFDQPASFIEGLLEDRPRYVRILRRDLNRQAVSLWIAEQTGVWGRGEAHGDRANGRPRYSFAGIRGARARIALSELRWERYFRLNGIEPIEVVYEELSANYQPTVAGVLDRLLPGVGVEIPPPVTAQQADARSDRYLARFLEHLGRHNPRTLRERVEPRVRGLLRWG
jgi:LPS sulfotransferase NodH